MATARSSQTDQLAISRALATARAPTKGVVMRMMSSSRFARASALLLTALLTSVGLGASPAAAQGVAQTYYVPMSETAELGQFMAVLEERTSVSSVETVVSIVASGNGTIVRYDHWEDGDRERRGAPGQHPALGRRERRQRQGARLRHGRPEGGQRDHAPQRHPDSAPLRARRLRRTRQDHLQPCHRGDARRLVGLRARDRRGRGGVRGAVVGHAARGAGGAGRGRQPRHVPGNVARGHGEGADDGHVVEDGREPGDQQRARPRCSRTSWSATP